jgi:hypothetical protein
MLGTIGIDEKDYQTIKEFLFVDGTEEPASIMLGTIIKDTEEDGGFSLVGLSLVKQPAYMRRLERQHIYPKTSQKLSAKITRDIIEPIS